MLLIIHNVLAALPGNQLWRRGRLVDCAIRNYHAWMGQQLKRACEFAAVPGLDIEEITIVVGSTQLIGLQGTNLIIIGEALSDLPGRTEEKILDLAVALEGAAKSRCPDGWKVEVLIRGFGNRKDLIYKTREY